MIIDWLSNSFGKTELISIFLFIIIFFILFYSFYKVIQYFFYKERKHIFKYRIETPKNHRAITIGYIIDGKLHKTDIAGAIIQLYIDKYLDIVYEEDKITSLEWLNNFIKKVLPILISRSWVIKRSMKSSNNLLKSEKLVLKYLFPDLEKKDKSGGVNNNAFGIDFDYSNLKSHTIKLSDIRGRENNNKIFREIEDAVIDELEEFKYKNDSSGFILIKKIIKTTTLFISVLLLSFVFFKISSFKDLNHILLYLFFITTSFIIIYVFFDKVEKNSEITGDGNKILNEALGYRLYLEKVFRDRTNFFDLLDTDRDELSKDIPYLVSFNINNKFDKLVKSLEYDTEDKKEVRSLILQIIFWPIYIVFSAAILYFFLHNKGIF